MGDIGFIAVVPLDHFQHYLITFTLNVAEFYPLAWRLYWLNPRLKRKSFSPINPYRYTAILLHGQTD